MVQRNSSQKARHPEVAAFIRLCEEAISESETEPGAFCSFGELTKLTIRALAGREHTQEALALAKDLYPEIHKSLRKLREINQARAPKH